MFPADTNCVPVATPASLSTPRNGDVIVNQSEKKSAMYGLPLNFDISFFVSRALERVIFSQNTVDLAFDQRVGVTVELPPTPTAPQRLSRQERNKGSGPIFFSPFLSSEGCSIWSRIPWTTASLIECYLHGYFSAVPHPYQHGLWDRRFPTDYTNPHFFRRYHSTVSSVRITEKNHQLSHSVFFVSCFTSR